MTPDQKIARDYRLLRRVARVYSAVTARVRRMFATIDQFERDFTESVRSGWAAYVERLDDGTRAVLEEVQNEERAEEAVELLLEVPTEKHTIH